MSGGARLLERLTRALDRWGTPSFSPSVEWLAMCRILYAASQLVGWQTPSVRPLAGLGAAFFFPPLGPFSLLSEYPPVRIIQALYLGRDVALVSLLVGYRTPLAGWTVGITQIALGGLRYSAGKVDHELLVFAVPIILSFSAWGAALSVDAVRAGTRPIKPRPSGPPLAWFALLIGCTFFTSGFIKALTGWLDPGAAATRGYLLGYLRQHAWSVHALNTMMGEFEHLWLWKAMDYATVVFEMAVLVTVVRPAWFRTALTAALGFHLGVVGLLNIDFSRLIVCYLPFLFSPPAGKFETLRRYVERVVAWVGRFWPAVTVAVGSGYWLFGQRRGYPAILDEWPYRRPWSLAMAVTTMALVYLCWRDWLPLRRNTAATAVFTDAGIDDPPSRRRRIVFLLTGLVLPAQLACLIWISEPYPAPVGPLFMGNPDVDGQGRGFRQEFAVVEAGQAVSMSAALLLGVPEPYATNIATFRFPLGPVSVAGFPVGQQTWYERLATQGHKFSALQFHQVHDRLSDTERIYLARRFPRAERLEIAWWREALRAEAGQVKVDRTQLNTYSLALRP